MHERGYRYIGGMSFWRLTYPEIRQLHRGFELRKQREQDAQNGVTPQHRENLNEFSNQLENGTWSADGPGSVSRSDPPEADG